MINTILIAYTNYFKSLVDLMKGVGYANSLITKIEHKNNDCMKCILFYLYINIINVDFILQLVYAP